MLSAAAQLRFALRSNRLSHRRELLPRARPRLARAVRRRRAERERQPVAHAAAAALELRLERRELAVELVDLQLLHLRLAPRLLLLLLAEHRVAAAARVAAEAALVAAVARAAGVLLVLDGLALVHEL